MDYSFMIVLFLIGFVGSVISGMVDIGGSIIKYPMLLYVPPLLGMAAFSAHEVTGYQCHTSIVRDYFGCMGISEERIS